MGLDFIRSVSGKPHQKRWAKGHERAQTPGLFDIQFAGEARVATATLAANAEAQAGASVIVQKSGADLVVFEGLRPLGKILTPTSTMTAAVDACHGLAHGVIDRVGALGQTAEIRF